MDSDFTEREENEDTLGYDILTIERTVVAGIRRMRTIVAQAVILILTEFNRLDIAHKAASVCRSIVLVNKIFFDRRTVDIKLAALIRNSFTRQADDPLNDIFVLLGNMNNDNIKALKFAEMIADQIGKAECFVIEGRIHGIAGYLHWPHNEVGDHHDHSHADEKILGKIRESLCAKNDGRTFDRLIDFILTGNKGSGQLAWEKSYHLLAEAIASKDAQPLKTYLGRWYSSNRGSEWYDTHKEDDEELLYCGYWCFEAAAVAKRAGIDDGLIRDNKYYPSDLTGN